jgi:hypothetical protein
MRDGLSVLGLQESIWTEIWKELRFAVQCQGETKPIKKSQSLSQTSKSESVPFAAYNGIDKGSFDEHKASLH